MRTDAIEAIGIDDGGSLWVKPETATFPHIFREGMEVHWDAERHCLYGPKPRKWSYADWFGQIRDAALRQGVNLELGPATAWSGIASELRKALAGRDRGFAERQRLFQQRQSRSDLTAPPSPPLWHARRVWAFA